MFFFFLSRSDGSHATEIFHFSESEYRIQSPLTGEKIFVAVMVIFLCLLLIVAVSSVQTTTDSCPLQYSLCAQQTLQMTGIDRCSLSASLLKCLVDVTEICFPGFVDVVKGYQTLFEEECRPGSRFFTSVMNTGNCMANNLQQFEACELEGEFNNVAEVCSSVGKLTECFHINTEVVCGKDNGKVFRKVSKPLTGFLESCEKSDAAKAHSLSECERGILKCDRRVLSPKEYTCLEFQRNAECYVDVLRKDCGVQVFPFVAILERYVAQIPDYCNPESDFRKNFLKSRNCIFSNFSVIIPCHDQLKESLTNSVTDGKNDQEEVMLSVIRANLQHYDCMVQKLGSACGKEAAFVARYFLSPIESVMGDRCHQLVSKENCNCATGSRFSIMPLILTVLMTEILHLL